jgi:hypothetical protein
MPNIDLIQAEQIERWLIAPIAISGFAAEDADDIVTTALGTAATANSVVLAVSNGVDTLGYIPTATSVTLDKVLVKKAASDIGIIDGSGNEVYGRLSESAGVWTVSYYSLVAGVETSYSLPAQSVDMYFNYLFTLALLPIDAMVRINALVVGDDPSGQGGRLFEEVLTITGTTTMSALSFLPTPNTTVSLIISKASYTETIDFTRTAKVITWLASGRFDLVVGKYRVVARYTTLEL